MYKTIIKFIVSAGISILVEEILKKIYLKYRKNKLNNEKNIWQEY